MIKAFSIKNEDLENNLFPNFYLFKQKIKNYSTRKDIFSFNLGDENVLDVLTDGEHAGQKFIESGALFIKNSSVKRYNINEFDGFYISHEKNNQLKRSMLKKGDVLFTTIGNIGISAVVGGNVKNANINQNVVRMRVNENFTTPQYLSCFLNSRIAKFQVTNLFTGNIYPLLTYPKIKSIKVFVKDKRVEKKITELLVKADENQIKALKQISEAQKIFLNSLNVNFASIPKRMFYAISNDQFAIDDMMTPAFYYPLYVNTINEIKKNNHCVLLGEIANCKNGDAVGSVNYKSYLDRKETSIPFIRTSDLVNYDIDMFPDFFIEKDIAQSFNQDLQNEDILFTIDGKIGLTAMLTEYDRCIIQSHIERIRCTEINPYYLFIVLSTKEVGLYQSKKFTVTQSTISTISNNLKNFIIPFSKQEKKIIELTEQAFQLKKERKKIVNESRLMLERSLDF